MAAASTAAAGADASTRTPSSLARRAVQAALEARLLAGANVPPNLLWAAHAARLAPLDGLDPDALTAAALDGRCLAHLVACAYAPAAGLAGPKRAAAAARALRAAGSASAVAAAAPFCAPAWAVGRWATAIAIDRMRVGDLRGAAAVLREGVGKASVPPAAARAALAAALACGAPGVACVAVAGGAVADHDALVAAASSGDAARAAAAAVAAARAAGATLVTAFAAAASRSLDARALHEAGVLALAAELEDGNGEDEEVAFRQCSPTTAGAVEAACEQWGRSNYSGQVATSDPWPTELAAHGAGARAAAARLLLVDNAAISPATLAGAAAWAMLDERGGWLSLGSLPSAATPPAAAVAAAAALAVAAAKLGLSPPPPAIHLLSWAAAGRCGAAAADVAAAALPGVRSPADSFAALWVVEARAAAIAGVGDASTGWAPLAVGCAGAGAARAAAEAAAAAVAPLLHQRSGRSPSSSAAHDVATALYPLVRAGVGSEGWAGSACAGAAACALAAAARA